jgi:3-hydroxybutyryl-CoA dehydrogenase
MEGAVAVLGAGVMGHGIAQLFAQAGASVRLQDVEGDRLAAGLSTVEASLALLVEEQVLTAAQAAAARGRIEPTTSPDRALAGAGFVVEAIPELLEAKLELFDRIERVVDGDAIVASNTSTLPISLLAQRARRPERMVIVHFFNPAQLVPLVEVLPHPLMPPAVVERVLRAMRWIGKHPVRLGREIPGFVANRLQAAVVREAFHLVELGVASLAEIDEVVTEGPGFRWPFIGPVETADLGGLDTWLRLLDNLAPGLSRADRAPEAIRERVARGELGAKTGRGLADHAGHSLAERARERDRLLIGLGRLKRR